MALHLGYVVWAGLGLYAGRLLARQRRQDAAIDPRLRPWDGAWTTLVVTSVGTDARTRAALRSTLHGSVGLSVVLRAPCPVTVVRPTAEAEAEAPEPAPANG